MRDFDSFAFWFIRKQHNEYDIVLNISVSKEHVGSILVSSESIDINLDDSQYNISEIKAQFEKFELERPEHYLGEFIDVAQDIQNIKQQFIDVFTGALYSRRYRLGKDVDSSQQYIDRILKFLDSTDFYTAPASTIYHESHPSGLLIHTCNVYNKMLSLKNIEEFSDLALDSATLCCFVHDWCKINLYENYKRNVKNEETGQWEKVDAYRRGTFDHPLGHGTASMYMAMKLFNLTEEEALAIRWHMSMFNVASNEINEYQQACENYPMVHLLQFSDQLAITNYIASV